MLTRLALPPRSLSTCPLSSSCARRIPIRHTLRPEETTALGAKLCYSKAQISDLKENEPYTLYLYSVQSVSQFKVGDHGVARTRLALIGEALINGQIVEVKSEGGFINENEEIEIIRVSGNSLFVAKVKSNDKK